MKWKRALSNTARKEPGDAQIRSLASSMTEGEDPIPEWRVRVKCQRCYRGESKYRVYTDIMDLRVCVACAEEAGRLGIPVEALQSGERTKLRPVLCA
jgi:hypothetical protein